MNLEPLFDKFSSFGACTKQVDGHNLLELRKALETSHDDSPLVVLAQTLPYQGMDILKERYPHLHYVRFKDDLERDSYKKQLTRMRL